MKIGTKSVLYGAHCMLVHPFMVALAWWKLYGFPFDPRLWVAFFVHDLGYVGKSNIDGEEGKQHPLFGAQVMHFLFDGYGETEWFDFTAYHSGSFAKKYGKETSKLYNPDKLTQAITPGWLYLPLVRATGEIIEYLSNSPWRTCPIKKICTHCPREWYEWLGACAREKVYANV